MEQMVANGFFCGGQPPMGYCKEVVPGYSSTPDGKEPPKRLVLNPEQAEIVRFAFDLFLTRRKVAAVRDYLNSVTGRHYTSTSAKYLLQNEVYVGNYIFGDWRKDDAHPAIVDKEVWLMVQAILEERVDSRVSREPTRACVLPPLWLRVYKQCGKRWGRALLRVPASCQA